MTTLEKFQSTNIHRYVCFSSVCWVGKTSKNFPCQNKITEEIEAISVD